ncbi:MAG: hypothetical protein HC906_06060 [Bacteroidales bacterium]|nr:hypothetical protein [Bacteroidales bacterium]
MTPFGPGMVTRQIEFPYFPLVNKFPDHSITAGLENVLFRFASSITYSGDSSIVFTPIVKTSEKSGTQSVSAWLNVVKEWDESDFPLSGVTLAATLEGPIVGSEKSKLVVVGDADLFDPVSQQGPNPDNINLAVNSIDWLSDDTGLIDLRTKGATTRLSGMIFPTVKGLSLKYFNFLFPIVI